MSLAFAGSGARADAGTRRRSRVVRHVWLTLLIAGAVVAPASMLVAGGGIRSDIARAGATLATSQSALHEIAAVPPAAPRVATVRTGRAALLATLVAAASTLLLCALGTAATRRRVAVRLAGPGPADPRGPPSFLVVG
jgi:hypothetical protein